MKRQPRRFSGCHRGLFSAWLALTPLRQAQDRPSLSQREREQDNPASSSRVGGSRAERSDGPDGLQTPFWPCREAQGVGRARSAACALRDLTRCRCLSGESEANKASSAAPPRARASQAAHSEAEGHGQWGRLFFGYFLLAEQKKVTAPPGAHPGRQRLQSSTVSQAKKPKPPRRPLPPSESAPPAPPT